MRKQPLTMHWFWRMVLIAAAGCVAASVVAILIMDWLNVPNAY